MTYVSYFECDGCGRRAHTDLTPSRWTFPDGKDFCPDCTKEREAQRTNEDQNKGEK